MFRKTVKGSEKAKTVCSRLRSVLVEQNSDNKRLLPVLATLVRDGAQLEAALKMIKAVKGKFIEQLYKTQSVSSVGWRSRDLSSSEAALAADSAMITRSRPLSFALTHLARSMLLPQALALTTRPQLARFGLSSQLRGTSPCSTVTVTSAS